jgi:hypothetical protein
VLTVAALAAAAAVPATTVAATQPTFALTSASGGAPLLSGRPGALLRGTARVSNLSDRSVTVRLQPADVTNATNGNADYAAARPAHAGRWLRLGAKRVRLAPGAARAVAFTVRVPADAAGGSHYAGVVATDAAEVASASASRSKASKRNGFRFSRINRQAMPVTVRLPGPLTRRLSLRSTRINVQPSGAALVLGLRPGGTTLIPDTKVRLRIARAGKSVLRYATTLGQLFPGSPLGHRVPWKGRPTAGDYRVTGSIRPRGAAAIRIDRTVAFTAPAAKELVRETPPVAQAPSSGLPTWALVALGVAALLLLVLSLAVLKLVRDRRSPSHP